MDLLHHDIIPGYFNSGHTISAPVLFLKQYGKFRQYHGLYGHLVTPVILMLIWPLQVVVSSQLILTLLLCSSISLSSSFRSLLSCLLSCTLSLSLYYSLNFPLNCSFGKNYVRLMIPDQRYSTSGQKFPPLDTLYKHLSYYLVICGHHPHISCYQLHEPGTPYSVSALIALPASRPRYSMRAMCSWGSTNSYSQVVNGCPTLQASGYERTTIEFTISLGDRVFRNIGARGFALVISLS
jgi:hypothetical protein